MVIRPSFARLPAARPLTKKSSPPPADGFKPAAKPPLITWKTGAILAVPVAAGIYAGLASGTAAGIAGALAGGPGGAMLGGLGGAMISQHLFKAKESTVVGTAIGGTILGGAAGLAGGAYLGALAGSPWQAAGLGLLGVAAAGLIFLNRDN